MSSTSNLTSIQEAVIATEVSLAKNYAIKSNNLATETNTELNTLKHELYVSNNNLKNVTTKLQNLCNLLSNATISGVNPDDLKYENL
jgi:hypothetical protein